MKDIMITGDSPKVEMMRRSQALINTAAILPCLIASVERLASKSAGAPTQQI
jgi:hypothetical protein